MQIDISLIQLYKQNKITLSTVRYCLQYNIILLSDLIDFIQNGGEFKLCGKRVQNDINNLYREYLTEKLIPTNNHIQNRNNNLEKIESKTSNIVTIENQIKDFDKNYFESVPNITLKELIHLENISERTINICKKYKLTHLKAIIKIYKEKRSFLHLFKCGLKSQNELINICEKYLKNNEFENKLKKLKDLNLEEIPNIGLEELIRIEKISTRTANVCRNNRIDSLKELLIFYTKEYSFIEFENCGLKSNQELIEICNKYIDKINSLEGFKEVRKLSRYTSFEIYNELSTIKKAVLNRQLESLISFLSVRSSNALNQEIKEGGINGYINYLLDPKKQFLDITNVGIKSAKEISHLAETLKSLIIEIDQIEDIEFNKTSIIISLENLFPNIRSEIQRIVIESMDQNDNLQIFRLLSSLLRHNAIFEGKKKKVFINCICEGGSNNIKNVASELKISNERVRQMASRIKNKLLVSFGFVHQLKKYNFLHYGIANTEYVIALNESLRELINDREKNNFSIEFIGYIFSIIYSETHIFWPKQNIQFEKNDKKLIYETSHNYVLNKKIFENFDLVNFLGGIISIVNNKIYEDFKLYSTGYISQFIKEGSGVELDQFLEFAESILLKEFNIVCLEGHFIIPQNTKKPLTEILYEILYDFGELKNISQLKDEIDRIFPDLDISETVIRSALRDKLKFIYIGRSSTYGLREWEERFTNIKGGTIRDIVEDFLKKNQEPQHIMDIFEYVYRFRKTNVKNVLSNIKLDKSKRFKFFTSNIIGLSNQKFKNNFPFKRIAGSRFSKKHLSKMTGWKIERIISHMSKIYNYHPSEVKYILLNKINEGEIHLNDKGALKK